MPLELFAKKKHISCLDYGFISIMVLTKLLSKYSSAFQYVLHSIKFLHNFFYVGTTRGAPEQT